MKMTRENVPSYNDKNQQQQKPSMNPTPADPSKDNELNTQPKKQPEVWADKKPGVESEESDSEFGSDRNLDRSKKQPM